MAYARTLGLLSVLLGTVAFADPDGLVWRTDLGAALKEARSDRPILAYFHEFG